jgi:hypothetical protein
MSNLGFKPEWISFTTKNIIKRGAEWMARLFSAVRASGAENGKSTYTINIYIYLMKNSIFYSRERTAHMHCTHVLCPFEY